MNAPLRMLIVEDSDDDALLIAHELRRGGYDLIMKRVDTRQAMSAALADQSWDIVISDYLVPGFGGLEALELLQARGLDLPFILISGTMGEDIAVSAMKAGAHDYLMKDKLARLVPAVTRELQEVKVRQARRQAEHALQQRAKELEQEVAQRVQAEKERERLLEEIREQAQRIQQIVDTVPEGVLLVDGENRITLANPAGQRDLEMLTSARVGEILHTLGDRPLSEFLTWPADPSWHEIGAGGHAFEVIARPIQAASEPPQRVLVIRDMTYERAMQDRAHRQDRLAAIGRLAGGVAHDFNNLLTAIQGYTEFVLDKLAPDDLIRADLQEVQKAADRAAALTKQLLIFSRKQVLQPVVLDLNTVIADMEEMLRRLIGEDIALNTNLSPSLGRVMADPGQIEQVIMNLSINARDAMPQGGRLALETRNVVLDETYAQEHRGVAPGTYVLLAVSDTGAGMSEEVKSHLFEPFFTTKERGRGTGLGLSTVHGIVTQSGGHVEVYSELGVGTTFKIYLPRAEVGAEPAQQVPPIETSSRGTETILLAEDEDIVRELARRILERQGYTVLAARLPSEALRLSQEHDGPIALLVTDVVMPEMGGKDLAQRLVSSRPEIKVLYISGYTDDVIVHHGVLESGVAYLEKPFTSSKLVHQVRKVLDEARSE